MHYRSLGRTGLKVSPACLGAMMFGAWGNPDHDESVAVIHAALEAGINFIDTADVYSAGESEEIVGKAIAGRRDEVVLATKFFAPMGDKPNMGGGSRYWIMKECEASLRRLGTDYIDLYQVHCWDEATPLEETLSALTDLVRSGKARYIGVSNFMAWQIVKALGVSELHGFEKFVCLQPQYSLVERGIEDEALPACVSEGLGVILWGPLGGGFLSGKYRRGERPPEDSRIAGAEEWMDEYWEKRATERNWRVLDAVGAIAEETGKSYAQVSLNWLLCQDGVTAPIIGARTNKQLEDNLGASGWRLDEKQVQRLSEAAPPEKTYPARFIEGKQRV